MGSSFNNLTIFQHHDHVRFAYSGQPMCNNKCSAVVPQFAGQHYFLPVIIFLQLFCFVNYIAFIVMAVVDTISIQIRHHADSPHTF